MHYVIYCTHYLPYLPTVALLVSVSSDWYSVNYSVTMIKKNICIIYIIFYRNSRSY